MNFDYNSSVNRMIASLQSKVSWASILDFSSNRKIIEAVAKEVSEIVNYDNYLSRENQWVLAKNSSSLLTTSDILGYRVHRKVGSKGYIQIAPSPSFNQPYAKTIMINKYTLFSDSTDPTIKFCTVANDSIPLGSSYKEIFAVQGIPKTFSITARGYAYEEIKILNANIEDSYYEVYVNGVKWNEVSNLLEAGATDQNYEIKNLIDFTGVVLKFGNNIFGKKLSSGDSIVFNYIETMGAKGNISRIGAISNIESTIYDDTALPVVCYCKNVSSFDGGSDIQDKEEIRYYAPRLFQTGDRAITKDDYKVILSRSGIIYKSNVWGEYEYLIDRSLVPGDAFAFVPLQENKIHIAGLKNTGEPLNESDKAFVIDYVNRYKSPTDIIEFNDPEIAYIRFISNVYVKDRSFSLTTVKTNVINELSSFYSFQKFDFGTNIYETDYKTLIDNVPGVDHNYTQLRVFNRFRFNQTSSASTILSLFPIQPTVGQNYSVQVYLRDVNNDLAEFIHIGNDDGSGTIVGITSNGVTYDLSGSTINYSNGDIYINIVSPLSGRGNGYLDYEIKAEYTITDSDFLLKKRSQIFRFGSADVNCLYMQ